MTRSDHRSGPSRATVFALLAAGLTLLIAAPASAKKKKPAARRIERQRGRRGRQRDAQGRRATTRSRPSQANDTEKPHTILDTSQEAPKTDSLGHVHFASPNGEGLGRVVVNAPATDKVKVFLEGRLFGTAPLTIYSVPKGDYIVEAQYPNGKEVSKPVTVSENEETAVDLGGAKTAKADGGGRQRQRVQQRRDDARPQEPDVRLPGRRGGGDRRRHHLRDPRYPGGERLQEHAARQPGGARRHSAARAARRQDRRRGLGVDGRRPGRRRRSARVPLIFGGSEKAPAAPSGTPQAFMLMPVASPAMTGGAFSMRF